MEITDWAKTSSEVLHQLRAPKSYIGDVEAEAEWQNPRKSSNRFIHTTSYQDFKDLEWLYLFGRRGSGKTSIMRMLDYQINHNRVVPYCCSIVMDQEKVYNDLAIQLRGSPFSDLPHNELVHLLNKQWGWIFRVSAMQAVVKTFKKKLKNDSNFKTIVRYLKSQNLLSEKNLPIQRIAEFLYESLNEIEYMPLKLGLAIMRFTSRLIEPQFNKALESMIKLLNNEGGLCLLLLDSIEIYNVFDKISQAVISALIETVRHFYIIRDEEKILAKIAFPSEIYPHIHASNQEKMEGKILFILWQHKDLVSLIAKRHFQYAQRRETIPKKFGEYSVAKDYLYETLPPKISSDQGAEFDTLAYIIRHTQKKPRQVITLVNIIFTLAEEENLDMNKIPHNSIKKGVHARLDILLKGTMDIYERIYPNAEKILRRVLNKAPSHFDSSTLDKLIKEASSLRKKGELDAEDVKRMLIESGAIGEERKIRTFKEPGLFLVEVVFEYQVKNFISTSGRSRFAIHPMFYQELNCELDLTRFIYPLPYEDEEKELLEQLGIKLG